MPEGCRERFDFEFFHYVATYNLMRRKSTLSKLNALDDSKNVIVLRTDREVQAFVSELENKLFNRQL